MFTQNTLFKSKLIIGFDLNYLKMSRCFSMALQQTIYSPKPTNSTQSTHPAHLAHLQSQPQSQFGTTFGFVRHWLYKKNYFPCSDYDFSKSLNDIMKLEWKLNLLLFRKRGSEHEVSNLAHLVHQVQIAHPVTQSKH